VAESFFSTMKTELIYRRPWPTQREARLAIHDYIGTFYNYARRHSFLGNLSPVEYERMFMDEAALAA
jgi:putative transposase